MNEDWRQRLEAEVRDALARESSGHDVHHALRVRHTALRLAEREGGDPDIVGAAALLHDIGHTEGRDGHAASSARAAADLLRRAGFPDEKIDAVVTCIEHHHWSPGNERDLPDPSIEYRVFADADRLDALGAIGIARAFAFGGAHGRPIWDPDEGAEPDPAHGSSSVHHFADKLLRLEEGMYTATARDLAASRTKTLRSFLDRFHDEWSLRDLDGERQR
ncbi:MAG: HD domain-containing protein [Acidobacteria bacterium]|nr:HD domain-containing protein [Acidobacteriota bacterium]NIM60403.1 HD domain-containing protein [Acidobacteriota bacterium]NIO58578.1 HD domain-containing protein [Acidobacteriota bacterium]NIQ29630.1 HD domain-containing protein [Acidobacteriota bacterium]NIQ84347.1 HD domain-containing protein [Acidobacteriota bacterium]